jgi:hypothetical protein
VQPEWYSGLDAQYTGLLAEMVSGLDTNGLMQHYVRLYDILSHHRNYNKEAGDIWVNIKEEKQAILSYEQIPVLTINKNVISHSISDHQMLAYL